MGQRGRVIAQGAGGRSKAKRNHDENEDGFENGEDELEVAGLLDAQVVQAGHKPNHTDGEDLRPQQGKRTADGLIAEPLEGRKKLQGASQADGDGGGRSRLGHGKPGPHIEKSGRVAVSAAQEDVAATGIGQHGAQLGIGHGAEQREQASGDPGKIDERRGAGVAHHFAGN